MALVFTRDLARPLEGTPLKESLDSALAKASAALPTEAEELVHSLQGSFSAGIGPHKIYRERRETIDELARAIAKHRTVEMRAMRTAISPTRPLRFSISTPILSRTFGADPDVIGGGKLYRS